jgi:hypothetical protein
MEKGRMRYWSRSRVTKQRTSLAAQHMCNRITALGIFPRIYRVPHAVLPPGARSHAKAMVGALSFELELAFIGLFTLDPHVCTRACARSLSPDLHRHHDRVPAMGTAGTASRVMTCGGGRAGG